MLDSCRIFIVLLSLTLIGCDPPDASHTSARSKTDGAPRIVSLTPALTMMIENLGCLDQVVGVAQYETLAPAGTPVVGNFLDIDTERLLSVNPTLVVTMAGKEGVPPRLRELADNGRFALHVYPMPTQIDHVMNILSDPLAESDLGRVLGKAEEAEALKLRLFKELAQVQHAVADLDRPRVLIVIGLDPVMASGPNTVHDQLLQHAGGINAAEHAVVTAPTFDRESILGMQPEVIVLLRPDDPPLQPNDPRLATFAGLPIPAVRDQRIVLINDPTAMLPSTSMVRTIRQLAQAIHPGLDLDERHDE